jgi:hypothetical protein
MINTKIAVGLANAEKATDSTKPLHNILFPLGLCFFFALVLLFFLGPDLY